MIGKLIEKWNRQDEDTFHFRVSVAKSVARLAAGVVLMCGWFVLAGLALIVAEMLGIVEEL